VVREADLDARGPLDDVVVRDDVTRLVEHEARAERLLRLLARRAERVAEERIRLNLLDRDCRDLDDPGRAAAVDLVDREPVALLREGCRRAARGLGDLAENRRLAA